MEYQAMFFYLFLVGVGGTLGYLYGGYMKQKAVEKYMAAQEAVKKVADKL